MRYFQASDPKERYTFKDYLMSRVVKSLMLLLVAAYVLAGIWSQWIYCKKNEYYFSDVRI